MAAKRGSGKRPGTVTPCKDRDLYQARVTLPDGRRPAAYFKTAKEGWAWNARTLVDAQRGAYIRANHQKTGDLLTHWLEDVASKTLTPNSLYNYRLSIEYVLPHIGGINLKDLKRHHIERTFSALEHGENRPAPLSRATLGLVHRVVKKALDYAEDDELIVKSPMRRMKAPRVEPADQRVLTIQECEQIFRAVQDTRWFAPFFLIGTTGMRPGELLGLQWDGIDWDAGTIRLQMQTGRLYGQPGVRLLPLKTAASNRVITLPPVTLRILRQHQTDQDRERGRADWTEHGVVFCQPDGGLYFRSQAAAVFTHVTRECGIAGATLKTFRHTISTRMQERGVPLRGTQALLGHATARTTMQVYSHATQESGQLVADAMASLFGSAEWHILEGGLTRRETA